VIAAAGDVLLPLAGYSLVPPFGHTKGVRPHEQVRTLVLTLVTKQRGRKPEPVPPADSTPLLVLGSWFASVPGKKETKLRVRVWYVYSPAGNRVFHDPQNVMDQVFRLVRPGVNRGGEG
jgi:hypothetical protein